MDNPFEPCSHCGQIPFIGHAMNCSRHPDGPVVPCTEPQTKEQMIVWHWLGTGENFVPFINV